MEGSSFNSISESKQYNIKQFINAVREYCVNRTEETANLINRYLQILSVTIDLSIFDPHTTAASEFFVSLHELLMCLEPRSSLAWCCVGVLSTCCRNPAARVALIHTYQYLPLLSRLLGEHLSTEKRVRLLTLLQELTCGIKISWQIPHLSHLLSLLTKWVESDSEDLVCLSLGVLVNLCYKNLPAMYTLSRCVDLHGFMRTVMALQGTKVEVHICKLLIIFDYSNGNIAKQSLVKLCEVTFRSMREAFKLKDNILLRHIVEFFLDIKIQEEQNSFILNFKYDTEIEKLLEVVENNTLSGGDSTSSDPECINFILQFLHSLVEQKLPKMPEFYERLVTLSLQWLHYESVSSQALSVLRAIAVNLDVKDPKVLEPMLPKLPVFLIELEMNSDETPRNVEYNRKLSSLMELLASLMRVESLRENVKGVLKEEHLQKIFRPLLSDPVTRKKPNEFDSPEMVAVYVNALVLINEMVRFDVSWFQMQEKLLENKQIHILIAQAFYSGTEAVRLQMLHLTLLPTFPRKEVAKAMVTLQPTSQVEEKPVNASQMLVENFCFPSMSVAQEEKLDDTLNKLRSNLVQNNLSNVATSEVMELYEYKLASMGHAERAATASVEAASHRCTHLEHRVAQLQAELSRTRQLLFHAQQAREDAAAERDAALERGRDVGARLEAERGRARALAAQGATREKALRDVERRLEEADRRGREAEARLGEAEAQLEKRQTLVHALQENLTRKEQVNVRKEEALAKANLHGEHLKSQIAQWEQKFHEKEAELAKCTIELHEKKKIIDTVTKLMASK